MVKQCTPHSGRSGPVALALFSVLFPLLSQPIRMVNDNYIIRVIRVNVFWRHPANHVIRVIRVNVFLTTPRNHIIPPILNSFDNFVYISPSLYGGNVHFFAAYPKKLRVRGGENTGNHPSEPPKHRTSLHKTSDVCGRNLGTFHRRSPMFSGFRTPFLAEIPENPPFLP